MLLIPLLAVGFSMFGKTSGGPFNFRDNCYVMHLANTFSARCDGANKLIKVKDLLLDSRSTNSMSEMELKNFESVTLDSSVRVSKIKINNTKHVSLYINNLKLNDLVIESVDTLTIKSQILDNSTKPRMERMFIRNVSCLKLMNEDGLEFLWPVNNIEIIKVEDFGLDSLNLRITAKVMRIENSNMRLKNRSSFYLEGRLSSIKESVLYIEQGHFTVQVLHFSVSDSKIDIENGLLEWMLSNKVEFSRNSLYGFEREYLMLDGGHSIVKFVNNEIFTNSIVNLLKASNERVSFTNNSFGCTDCIASEGLLTTDLKDTGETNYCYTTCSLTLNQFKQLLNNSCVCNIAEVTVGYSLMCAPCSLNTISDNVTDNDNVQYIVLTLLFLILIIVILCFICCRSIICKSTLLLRNCILSRKFKSEQSDSQVVMYKKPPNDDFHENSYEPVGTRSDE